MTNLPQLGEYTFNISRNSYTIVRYKGFKYVGLGIYNHIEVNKSVLALWLPNKTEGFFVKVIKI